jgi:hypothetical protein
VHPHGPVHTIMRSRLASTHRMSGGECACSRAGARCAAASFADGVKGRARDGSRACLGGSGGPPGSWPVTGYARPCPSPVTSGTAPGKRGVPTGTALSAQPWTGSEAERSADTAAGRPRPRPLAGLVRADTGYADTIDTSPLGRTQEEFRTVARTVGRGDGARGFQARPCRWAMERAFGRLAGDRRPALGRERLTGGSESTVGVAATPSTATRPAGRSACRSGRPAHENVWSVGCPTAPQEEPRCSARSAGARWRLRHGHRVLEHGSGPDHAGGAPRGAGATTSHG